MQRCECLDFFDWVNEKLNDLFNWLGNSLSDIVGGSRGHHVRCHCKCCLGNQIKLHGIRDESIFSGPTKTFPVNDVNKINFLHQSTRATVEGEKEDLYTSCRKDARKMECAATDHIEASKIAHSKGDHILAKELKKKAKEENEAAKRLHEGASRKILKENNKDNGIMKLDLHGLHVPEAIQAVKEHLNKIEKLNEKAIAKLKQQRLEVVTGIGNHSRGAPKLPGAVRSFLEENGYDFDGNRPGVIMVHLKYHSS